MSAKLNPPTLTVLLATLGLSLAACTTFGHKDDAKDGLAVGKGAPVVSQIGHADPVVAPKGRSYYLEMRQAKALLPRMTGALATGEGEAAVSYARAYLAQHPGDGDAMSMLAAALIMTRKYDLASYYASQVERARPGDPTALNIRGMAIMLSPNQRVADYYRAAGLFRQALDADSRQVAPALNLGSLALELGDAKTAASVFAEAASRCDQCEPALMGVGTAASRARDFAAANAAFKAVLAKNPKHPYALYNLALVAKNGYNDRKQAEKYLFVLLDVARPKDAYIRGRAQTLLRMVKGEATEEERTMIADDEDAPKGAPGQGAAADPADAEMLMTDFQDGE
jgi:tetratricopeptide (TPR) repeat protein